MPLIKRNRPTSMIGLALDGREVQGVTMQRSGSACRIEQAFHFTLSLDPLTNDPELVGREIRKHLDEAGVRERHCVVCLPLGWVLTLACDIPDIPEADVKGFLNLEAEQGFPHAPSDLVISTSRFVIPNQHQHALLAAVPANHVNSLKKALISARLLPLSFSLGITNLEDTRADSADGELVLLVGNANMEMLINTHGGVTTLRVIEGSKDAETDKVSFDADIIAREIRITLGQLPKVLRDRVHRIKVYGLASVVGQLIKQLTPMARGMNLGVTQGSLPSISGSSGVDSFNSGALSAAGLVCRQLLENASDFEFLPPTVNRWTQYTARFASSRMLYAGAAASVVLLLIGSVFLWQQIKYSTLDSKWRGMRQRVTEVESLQQMARKYRPWYDETIGGLRIVRCLTEAFPEDGSVTAKLLQLKELSEVSCSGQARDNQALYRMIDKLRESGHVSGVKILSLRGKSPIQFSLVFRWLEGGSREN